MVVKYDGHYKNHSRKIMMQQQQQAAVRGPVVPPGPVGPVPTRPLMRTALPMSYPMMEGLATQVLLAGLVGAAAEAGLILRGASLPVLGRAGAVGGMSSAGASLGLILGRMVSRREIAVFGALGNFCDATVGVSLSAADFIVGSVNAFVTGAAVSAAIESYQRSRLVQGKLGLDPVSRALLVGAFVALSQLAANRFSPNIARAVFGCSKAVSV